MSTEDYTTAANESNIPQKGGAAPGGGRQAPQGGAPGTTPPSSNTGAQNTGTDTHPPFARRAIVDYAALTLPDSVDPERVGQLLGLNPNDVRDLDRGVNGYRSGRAYGQTRVYFGGNPGMGTHVIISGDACRELEAATGPTYWKQLYRVLQACEGHVTRLDLAIDDTTGALDLDRIEREATAGSWRGRWKGGQVVQGFGAKDGKSIYFGSRQSNAMVRFYDKAAEQGTDYTWARAELELKRDHAMVALQLIAFDSPVGELVTGILRHYLNFIEESPTDTNRARWPVAAWWDAWLGDVEALRLTTGERVIKTIEEIAAWVERQVAPSLATLKRGLGRRWEAFLLGLDRSGASRMTERHHQALQLAGAW